MDDNQHGMLLRFQLLLEIEGFSSRITEPTDDNPISSLIVTIYHP
jgi:hypothetical protein